MANRPFKREEKKRIFRVVVKTKTMDFEKLEKDFAVKPYHERNKDLMRLSIGLKFVFQLVCVIAGLLFMKGIFYDLTKNELLSFLISFVCLVIIEATKQVLVTTTFKQKLVYSRVGALQVIFTLLLIGFSIFISKNGVESYYIIQNNTPQLVDVNFILQPYNDKLEAARQDKEKSFSLTWDGSKEQTRAGQQLTISSVDKILSLEKQIEGIRLDVAAKNELAAKSSKTEAAKKAAEISYFVIVIDLLLIASTLYPLFYRFKSLEEWQLSKLTKEVKNGESVEKIAKKKQKERPLPYERGGNSSDFIGIGENMPESRGGEDFEQQNEFKPAAKKQQNNNEQQNGFEYLSTMQQKDLQQKRKIAADSIKRAAKSSKSKTSKAAKKNEILIIEIDKILKNR